MTLKVANITYQNQSVGNVTIPAHTDEEVDKDLALNIARSQHLYPTLIADTRPIADELPFELDDGRVMFSWLSPFGPHDGVGHFSCVMTKYLLRDPDIVCQPLVYMNKRYGNLPVEVDEAIGMATELTRVGVLFGLPWKWTALASPYRIHIGFYETTNLSPRWIQATRNGFDEVWTFSEFCNRLFSEKLDMPVYRLRGGFDPEEYFYDDYRDGPFKFAIAGRLTGRKGVYELQDAFRKTFGKGDDVELHIKTRALQSDLELLEEFKRHMVDDERIIYHLDEWNVHQMRRFFQSIDCFVFPTHGEGLGLPPLEATACGAYSIVTDWSGCSEYVCEPYFMPLEVSELEPAKKMMCDGDWAKLPIDDLCDKMRWCYENRDKVNDLGKSAANWVRDEWTAEHGVETIKQRLFSLCGTM